MTIYFVILFPDFLNDNFKINVGTIGNMTQQ